MTKIKRDAVAFATRVKMSRQSHLFVLVEGRKNDRPFYERVLKKHHQANEMGFSVRTVEDLRLDGKSSGGKPFALSVFRRYEELGLLRQMNSEGQRVIAFALDNDFDDFLPDRKESLHMIRTHGVDVESDILWNSKFTQSVAISYGLTIEQARKAVSTRKNVFESLSALWLHWVQLRAMAVTCGTRDAARYGGPSTINVDEFGVLLVEKEKELRKAILEHAQGVGAGLTANAASAEIQKVHQSGEHHRLLKGRWVAKYVRHLVDIKLADETVSTDFAPEQITHVALVTIDYRGGWITHYHRQISTLLNAA